MTTTSVATPTTAELTQQQVDNTAYNNEQQQETEQRQQELAKLRAIEHKVQQIHDKLATRLPLQRCHLAARVCGAIWAARTRLAKLARESDSDMESVSATTTSSTTTSSDASAQEQQQQQQQLYSQLAKKLRMELGAFDYQTKEQGELLTRLLCELDDILSFGDAEVKRARKALVVAIQSDALPLADAMRDQSAQLKAFGEALLERLLAALRQPSTEAPAETASAETVPSSPRASATTIDNAIGTSSTISDSADDVEMQPLDGGDSIESAVCNDDANGIDDDDDGERDSDDASDDSEGEDEDMTAADDSDDEVREDNEVDEALPVWRPYYQLQKRRDGLYLVANLRGVEPANVHVQWLESVGVLRISGHKLPTQKDLAVTRFSGVPTFGRFEIAERLPVDALAMDSATQALRADGTLEIRMPFDVAPRWQQCQRQRLQSSLSSLAPPPLQRWQFHPSVLDCRRSLFDAPRCMVW